MGGTAKRRAQDLLAVLSIETGGTSMIVNTYIEDIGMRYRGDTGMRYRGDFWLSNQPEQRVAGELRVDGEDGARLSLSGSTKHIDFLTGMNSDHTFFGRLGRQPVTVAGTRRVQSGPLGEVWSAEIVLRGAHHAEPASAVYDCARFEIADIGHWLTQSSGLRLEEADDRPKLSLIYEPMPMPTATTAFGEVKLAQNVRRTGDGVTSLGIEQTWEIEMRFTPAQPLRKILDHCEHMRQLVTFGLGDRVTPRQLTLIISARSAPPECQTRQHHLYRRGWDPAAPNRDADDPSLLLSFFDEQILGGIAGVAAWLDLADAHGTAMRQLAAAVETRLPPDMRLVVVCSAAEAYERVAAGNRKGDVRRALRKLVTAETAHDTAMLGGMVIGAEGTRERWVSRVVDARNAVVHHGGEGTDPLRLRAYAEHVYLMVLRSLLEETGVPQAAVAQVESEITPPGFVEHGPWRPWPFPLGTSAN